jgi:hypothetical protein
MVVMGFVGPKRALQGFRVPIVNGISDQQLKVIDLGLIWFAEPLEWNDYSYRIVILLFGRGLFVRILIPFKNEMNSYFIFYFILF